jgi:N-acetylglucosaminyldiphosphoundecaprenol N-acetyl-beta-D-mannosaminyltransferase
MVLDREPRPTAIRCFSLLGVPIAAATMLTAIGTVSAWIESRERGKMVTFTNAHMLVEACKNPAFCQILNQSDLNCPDGMPLVWFGRRRGNAEIRRVCGPEFMPAFCETTAEKGWRHFFYGGAEGVAERAAVMLQRKAPGMEIAGTYCPPFRPLTLEEDEEIIHLINSSKPDVIWVGLGCPKQENWIAQHRNRLDASVCLAVGLAFDIAAGLRKRAPAVVRTAGMEWFYRLCQEPRRLWKRYLLYNGIFLYYALTERPQRLDHPSSQG